MSLQCGHRKWTTCLTKNGQVGLEVQIKKLNRFSVGILRIIRYCFLIFHIVSLFFTAFFPFRIFLTLFFFYSRALSPMLQSVCERVFFSHSSSSSIHAHIVYVFTFSTCVLLFFAEVFFPVRLQPISILADYCHYPRI